MRDLKTDFGIQLAYLRQRGTFLETTIADAEAKLNNCADLQTQYTTRVDTLTRSGELTDLGRRKALRALGAEFRGKLKLLEQSISGLEGNIRQVSQGLQPPVASAGDPIVDYLKGMEIRAHLRTKDPLELELIYRGEKPGSPTARALESSPIQMIPSGLIAEVHLEWGRQANPEESKKLDSLRELLSMYQYCLKVALDEFPIPEVEPAIVSV